MTVKLKAGTGAASHMVPGMAGPGAPGYPIMKFLYSHTDQGTGTLCRICCINAAATWDLRNS